LNVDKWHPVNQRERRLIAYLMQFRLNLKYVKGCHNSNADALSRIFEDMPQEKKL